MSNKEEENSEKARGLTRSEMSGSARDLIQARNISGGVHFHGAAPDQGFAPRQLPWDVYGFVNRQHELERLDALIAADREKPTGGSVYVIVGKPGVGKTSLAVRWAHRAQDRFPDGQLYVNLRGYDPGEPVAPEQALEGFLSALGVPPAAIPVDAENRSNLYRSLVADRHMLIVLDNAATASQVRPLLPGGAHTVVVITTRTMLSGLVALVGARRITVEVLPETEAVQLLRSTMSEYRSEDASEELSELASLCAGLPLALRIAAERASARPRMPLSALLEDLRDKYSLWFALSTEDGDEQEAVRSVFAWSFRGLPQEAAWAFRMLGVLPTPNFSLRCVAALVALPVNRTRYLLDVLVGAHLVEQPTHERYQLHDLLRAYAMEEVIREESPESRLAALRRVLTWYLHTASSTSSASVGFSRPPPLSDPGEVTHALVSLAEHEDALRWFKEEWRNLSLVIRHANHSGLDELTWKLSIARHRFGDYFSLSEDMLELTAMALNSARGLDRFGEAEVLHHRAVILEYGFYRLDEARTCYELAASIFEEIDDKAGLASVLTYFARYHLRRHQFEEGRPLLRRAITIFEDIGDSERRTAVLQHLADAHLGLGEYDAALNIALSTLAQARTLNSPARESSALRIAAAAHLGSGRVDDALAAAEDAVERARAASNIYCEGQALLGALGPAQYVSRRYRDALISFHRAATLYRDGVHEMEAESLSHTGSTYREMGRPEQAVAFHRQAISICRTLGDQWRLAISLDEYATTLAALGSAEEAHGNRLEAARLFSEFNDAESTVRAERIRSALDTG
ncbi:ATP-binding protein [Streptomyces malaysiensis]|uniref:Tetratricopeptide repeat protein n=1 Tax=Streptomyces malaysiensis subsp. samsunensis TaxID=459658 RepID=A0A9X2RX74_STRMQ|nr:tetratricopeptide repeat protein [Streptomyces samsunensis]MCQ8834221.1 tetratricopeptide repeat protein [Streptomyces samsunensis]